MSARMSATTQQDKPEAHNGQEPKEPKKPKEDEKTQGTFVTIGTGDCRISLDLKKHGLCRVELHNAEVAEKDAKIPI